MLMDDRVPSSVVSGEDEMLLKGGQRIWPIKEFAWLNVTLIRKEKSEDQIVFIGIIFNITNLILFLNNRNLRIYTFSSFGEQNPETPIGLNVHITTTIDFPHP
ncbi:hypothetical protein CEXT_377101 [Caerostris extrusa]|uniref:Uncharacterized protein n=1 Tax=Caerostris extrusa TaxID=172846 RepID=A0AAV4W0N8_CAEEX|nr:hypothetical protein CEXT_377101 [Caerostris extrusa]